MKESDRYFKFVRWSDVDQCYIGSCPELFGDACHGDNEAKVYKELCGIVDWVIETNKMEGVPLPEPKRKNDYSGKFVMRVGSDLHRALAYRALCVNESLNTYCANVLRGNTAAYGSQPQIMESIPAAVLHENYPLPRRKTSKVK